MSCEHWERLISRYLDGELPPSEADGLEEHIDSCERCREVLDGFRELSGILTIHTEPDPFFISRFRARRDEELAADGSLRIWRRLAVRLLPLAAAALLGAAAAVWFSPDDVELAELEARQLGNGFVMATEEEPYPVLQIAFEPFPEGEP